jgi:hypothetical protein
MEHDFSSNIESHSTRKISMIFIGTFQDVTGKKKPYLLVSRTVEVTAPLAFLMHKAS